MKVEIDDEGKYGRSYYTDDWRVKKPVYTWHEGKYDVKALAEEVGSWNEMIATTFGAMNDLLKANGSPLALEAPISSFPDFEHLEFRGQQNHQYLAPFLQAMKEMADKQRAAAKSISGAAPVRSLRPSRHGGRGFHRLMLRRLPYPGRSLGRHDLIRPATFGPTSLHIPQSGRRRRNYEIGMHNSVLTKETHDVWQTCTKRDRGKTGPTSAVLGSTGHFSPWHKESHRSPSRPARMQTAAAGLAAAPLLNWLNTVGMKELRTMQAFKQPDQRQQRGR